MIRKILLMVLLFLLVAGLAARRIVPGYVESQFNTVVEHPPYPISAASLRLHESLTIMDWHSDSMLWDRDFLLQADRGHVDLPRLQTGNVAIAMMTAATKEGT